MARTARLLRTTTIAVVAAIAVASPAGADPAEPTSMQSSVQAITPAVEGLEVRVVGGDSFLELRNGTGAEVVVLGYDGEPYLRFGADGVVEVNRAPRTHALNADRYAAGGTAAVGASIDDWVVVARDGTWAWHDHRTHWMSPVPPMGLGPGDQVVDGVVPLLVGGRSVEVSVVSMWMPPPAPWAGLAGLLVAAICLIIGWRRGRQGWLLTAAAVLASAVSLAERASLPAEAAPPITHVMLPLAAVIALAIGRILLVRRPTSTWGVLAAHLVAASELLTWAVRRRSVVVEPVLPTDLWWPLDRAATVAVAVLAVGAAVRLVSRHRSALGVDAHRKEPVDDLGHLLVGQ